MVTLTQDQARQFVLSRLDKEHVQVCARRAASALEAEGRVEVCYQPGDGTWYALFIATAPVLVGAAGGGTADQSPRTYMGDATFLVASLQLGTCVWFDALTTDFEWMAQHKLGYGQASAIAVGALLDELFKKDAFPDAA